VETGKRLAEMWKRNLGVDVAFVLRKTVLSSTLPEALLTELPGVIEERAGEIASHKRTRALPIYMGSERLLIVGAPFIGEASEQHAYYVLLTRKSPQSDPWALLSSTSSDDLKWGNFPWLQLAGGLIAVIGIGLFLQRYEVENPLRRLRAEVRAMAKQQATKIEDTRYGGTLGGIARDINATVEHFTHAPLPKSETAKKDIASILDPHAASADGKSFDVSSTAASRPSVPPPAAMAASLFGTPKAAPGMPSQPPAVPPSFAEPPAPSFSAAEPAPFVAPEPAPFVAPPVPGRVAAPPPPPVRVPTKPVASPSNGQDPDQAHFSQVFEEYLALRQKCGESVVGLSLDKFVAKLQSNRDQLISKHGCKTAQFTVYEKDGKAAIRAVPVRD